MVRGAGRLSATILILLLLGTAFQTTHGQAVERLDAKLPIATAFDPNGGVWTGSKAILFGAGPTGDHLITFDPATGGSSIKLGTPSGAVGLDGPAFWDGTHAFVLQDAATHTSGGLPAIKYDLVTETATLMPTSPPNRIVWASGAWDGTHFYVFGGFYTPSQVLRYDPATDSYAVMSATLPGSSRNAVAVWHDGNAYIIGGEGDLLNRIVRYDPVTDTATLMPTVLPGRLSSAAAASFGGRIYLLGGLEGSFIKDTILEYDPVAGTLGTVGDVGTPTYAWTALALPGGIHAFGGARGGSSASADIIRFHPGTPGPVPGLTAGAPREQAGRIDLSWNAPGDTGASAITGYRVFRSTSAAGPFGAMVPDLAATARSFPDSGLAHGTIYHYKVAALNADGVGQRSDAASARTNREPGTPTNPQATVPPTSTGMVRLTWDPPTDDGGITPHVYHVYRSGAHGGPYAHVGTSTTRKYEDAGGSATAFYRVSAENLVDEGPLAGPVSATPNPALPGGIDTDADGLLDADEPAHGANPTRPDTDEDGLCDGGQGLNCFRDGVPLADGEVRGWTIVVNRTESRTAQSDPTLADTDDDQLGDRDEHILKTDPQAKDTDRDGLSDHVESPGWPQRAAVFCPPTSSAAAAGACPWPDPVVRDLYMEVDWYADQALDDSLYRTIEEVYADKPTAPVAAPDGSGFYNSAPIRLHIDNGQTGGGGEIPGGPNADGGSTDLAYMAHMEDARKGLFHYALIACYRFGEGGATWFPTGGDAQTPGHRMTIYRCAGDNYADYPCSLTVLVPPAFEECKDGIAYSYTIVAFLHELGHQTLGARFQEGAALTWMVNGTTYICSTAGKNPRLTGNLEFSYDDSGDFANDCNSDGVREHWSHIAPPFASPSSDDAMARGAPLRSLSHHGTTWAAMRLDWGGIGPVGSDTAAPWHGHHDHFELDLGSPAWQALLGRR